MRRLPLLALMVALTAPLHAGAPTPPSAEEPEAVGCPVPPEEARTTSRLGHVAAAVNAAEHLDVLAVGSGGIMGPHGHPDGSLTHQMMRTLQRRLPHMEVRVVVQSDRGATAPETLKALEREMGSRRFDLVLWQTGTVDALRRLSPDTFRDTLARGARAVRDQGGDLVLIDPQFSRALRDRADLAPYERAFRDAAAEPGVALFDRLGLTSHWVTSGALDPEAATAPDRVRVAARMHSCLGQALAAEILDAAGVGAP